MEKRWVAESDAAGWRLDRFLTGRSAGPSRSFVQRILADGGALVNGKRARASQILKAGDEIVFNEPPPKPMGIAAEPIPLRIIFEDEDLLVVDKPRGLVVHPAAGNASGTLVNALLAHCRDLSGIGGVIRPGIVHRLDKDTTGLLVVAKNDRAHLALAAQLRERTMSRTYLALVHGTPAAESGRIEMPIGRHPVDRKRMAVVTGGRIAITLYRLVERLGPYSLLALDLATGRTHQIRVHLAALGHPVVGDRVYGRRHDPIDLPGQALHAARLTLVHPCTGSRLTFTSELPADFRGVLRSLGATAGADPEVPIL